MFRLLIFIWLAVICQNPRSGAQVTTPAPDNNCRADIGFVLDSSGSVTAANWVIMLQFVQDFADFVDYGMEANRIGVVIYGNDAILEITLDEYDNVEDFKNAVANIGYMDQSTNTASGIRVLRNDIFTSASGDRPEFPNIGIVMTDGESLVEPELTLPEAELARNDGIILFTVGIGNNLNTEELSGIANDPDSEFLFFVDDFDELLGSIETIFDAACVASEATVTDCNRFDIAFVLDASGSIGSTNWQRVLDFVQDLVGDMPIDVDDNRVGVITYSNEADLNIRLDDYHDRTDLLNAIGSLGWKNERTNTSGAIKVLREQLFNESNGDRANATNTAVFVTDGFSNVDAVLTSTYAAQAHAEGIRVFAVAIGFQVEMNEIERIVSDPPYQHEFFVDEFDVLTQWVYEVSSRTCSGADVSSPISYTQTCRADIAFIIDGSVGKTSEQWNMYLDFMQDIVSQLNIGVLTAQIGVVIYDGMWYMRLEQYSTNSELLQALGALPYASEQAPHLDEGLAFAGQYIFDPNYGDRLDAPNVAIVLVDSASSDPERTVEQGQQLRDDGASVFVVAVGDTVNRTELELVATDQNVMYVDDFTDLSTVMDAVLADACFLSATVEWSCDFEHSEVGSDWCALIQDGNDTFDWTMMSGPTPSDLTGPTSAYQGDYYIYIEASSPRVIGDEAKLIIPVGVESEGWYCLYFYRNMYGYHVGALQVFVRDIETGIDIPRWTTKGDNTPNWYPQYVSLMLVPGEEIGFRALTGDGYSGDVALDNIRFTEGACPDV